MIRLISTPCFSVSSGNERRHDDDDPITGRDEGERMTHYWGAKAIVERIGLRDATRLPHLIKRWGLPAFLRRTPGHCRNTYYSSESAITAWEIARGLQHRQILLAKEEARETRGQDGARGTTRGAST